jgi:hypothetical protein
VTEEHIDEIGIDEDGRLYVRPRQRTFPFIWRAAMGIEWDPSRSALLGPKPPNDWSYLQWFTQIVDAASGEYGVRLKISTGTVWTNVPDAIRHEIEAKTS